MTTAVTYSRVHPDQNWHSPGRPDLVVATRDPRYYPFSSESIANIGIGASATFEANTTGTATYQLHHSGLGYAVNSPSWSVSVGVAKSTDPLRTVTCETTSDVVSIRIPDSLTATGGSDGWVTVISPDGLTGYEFYAAKKFPASNPTGWSTKYPLIETDLLGHGVKAGRRASATSQLLGLVRKDELAAKSIRHMIGIAIPASCLKLTPTSVDGDNIGTNSSGGGYVWPAHNADNQANIPYLGLTAMGAVYAIPSTVNVAALGLASAEGLALARALQDYGAVVIAQAGTIAIQVEPAANQAQVTAMQPDWKILGPLLRRMTNHAGGSLNTDREPLDPLVTLGGGARRVSPLPEPTP